MKHDQDQTIENDELYIEELGEVRGGILSPRFTTLALGEEGAEPRPWKPPPFIDPSDPLDPRPEPKPTTHALGEEGPLPWLL